MPAGSARKRLRIGNADLIDLTVPQEIDNALTLRASLRHRVSDAYIPSSWIHAAASVGAAGTDAFLCHVGRSIAVSLRIVPDLAESSRSQLRSMRATLHAAVDARCDNLEARISMTESAKIVRLSVRSSLSTLRWSAGDPRLGP